MPFLTDLDERAKVKGSRDPLGLVPIWSRFGREVVGNLTTVSNSVRGFTTLLLGLYFADEIQEIDRGEEQSMLDLFLKFEQLAGYARVKAHGDRGVRGIRRVQTRLAESKRIRISAAQDGQILSNQKVYGLWGLFSMPARASALLLPREQRLTPAARDFVQRRYLPIFGNGNRNGRMIMDLLRKQSFDFEPEGKHAALMEALAKAHGRLTNDEKTFYRKHLAWITDSDTTHGKQEQLAAILAERDSNEFGFDDFRAVKRTAGKRGFDSLVATLDRIEALEHLLMPARVAFGFLLTQNGQAVDSVARKIGSAWKRPPRVDREFIAGMQPEIAAATGNGKSARRWLDIADLLTAADYSRFVEHLVATNTDVMQTRHGSAAWVSIESARLRVRVPDETEDLLPASEVENLWRSTYFINSLWTIARDVA